MILSSANSIKAGSSNVDRVYHGENFQFLGSDFGYTRDGSIVNGNGTYTAQTAGDSLLTDLIINYGTVATEAFSGCSNLTGVILTNKVTRVEEGAFLSCGITGLTIGDSMFQFEDSCFKGNPFTNVSLPVKNMIFDSATFMDCPNLTSFTLPSGCDTVCASMLKNCTSLTSLTLPSTLQIVGTGALQECSSLQNFTFQNIREIHNSAFLNCTSLTTVDIPSSIDAIEANAFSGCTAVTTFNIRSTKPPGRHRLSSTSYPGTPTDYLPSHLTEIHVRTNAPYTYFDGTTTRNGWQDTFFGRTVVRDL